MERMTRSDKYLWNICLEIYQQMYKEAEPSLDFKKELDTGYCSKPDWFLNHYLSMERQEEIVEMFFHKYNCSCYEKKMISNEIWLGSSPTSVKK